MKDSDVSEMKEEDSKASFLSPVLSTPSEYFKNYWRIKGIDVSEMKEEDSKASFLSPLLSTPSEHFKNYRLMKIAIRARWKKKILKPRF